MRSPSPNDPQSTQAPTVVLARSDEATLHVTVVGELDTLSINRLREHADRALAECRPTTVALDLDGVPFLDAAAAIQLRRLYHRVADAGGQLSITTAQPFTWWLLNAFTLTSAGPPHDTYRLQSEPGS